MKMNRGKCLLVLTTAWILGSINVISAKGLPLSSQNDSSLQAEVTSKALNKPKLQNVEASLHDGVVTLTGSVEVFNLKEEADKRTHRIKGVKAVLNNIEVTNPDIPDSLLQEKLVKAISYDRTSYGTTAFNAIAVTVRNGAVTLTGHAYRSIDADSAEAITANTPGVKDVVNKIEVDPLSPMDDRIRIQVFRSVYGFPSLNKYANDPEKPIRISVQSGNVTLYGAVDSQADKDAANIRATGVPGVFTVTNKLQVAGTSPKE